MNSLCVCQYVALQNKKAEDHFKLKMFRCHDLQNDIIFLGHCINIPLMIYRWKINVCASR